MSRRLEPEATAYCKPLSKALLSGSTRWKAARGAPSGRTGQLAIRLRRTAPPQPYEKRPLAAGLK
jgi:hypothetical protein